tara:strand:+ start:127 stop:1053 length:927 start_codon:yes stop_codon:yes gene_type:complete
MRNKKNILREILGSGYDSRDETLYHCPFCRHHKKKLSVNLIKGFFKCWVCDTKGAISYLIKRFGTIDDRHDWALLDQEVDFSTMDLIFNQPEEKLPPVNLPPEYICLAKKGLPPAANDAISYLWSRGIGQKDIIYHKIGFCLTGKYKKRIIIPSFDDEGNCNYFTARSYSGDWLSYKNPSASKNIIFNDLLINWDEPITLVEGPFDSIKMKNSIPILGSTLKETTKLFKKIVEKQTKVYIGLDEDALSKSMKIISLLLEYGLDVYKLDTSDIEDIGSITKTEAEDLKKEASQIDLESIFNIYWSMNEL